MENAILNPSKSFLDLKKSQPYDFVNFSKIII